MRRFLLVLLCAAMLLALLACGKQGGQTSVPTAGSDPATVPTAPATKPTVAPTVPATQPTEPTTVPTGPTYPFDEEESSHLFGPWKMEQVYGSENLGLPKLKDSFKVTVYVEFDDLGLVYLYVERAKAEKEFSDFFAKKTVIKQVKDSCYALLKEQGLSQKEADQYVKDTYGKTMDQYVQMTIENLKQTLNFDGMATNTHYYAEGKMLYILSSDGESWEEYTVDVRNGTMTIKEAVSPDGTFFLLGSAKELPKKLTAVSADWA